MIESSPEIIISFVEEEKIFRNLLITLVSVSSSSGKSIRRSSHVGQLHPKMNDLNRKNHSYQSRKTNRIFNQMIRSRIPNIFNTLLMINFSTYTTWI